MAKKSKPALPPESGYEWVKAKVDCGDLSMTYQVIGSKVQGRTDHDEDVSEYTEEEVRNLVCKLIDLDPKYVDKIEVEYA